MQPFISDELRAIATKPVLYINKQGIETEGLPASALADICDLYVKAGEKGAFKNNMEIAENAYNILIAFSKVGITALVDEVTGYQESREKDALQKFLEKFLLEEKGKWVKTFPDEFFDMIFKMKGLTWQTANKGKKPQWVGHHINDFVYSRIAPNVLAELREINPKNQHGSRKGKHTQFITTDFGHPKLKEHLSSLIALGRATGYNWSNFKRFVERAFPKFSSDGSAVQEIPFTDID